MPSISIALEAGHWEAYPGLHQAAQCGAPGSRGCSQTFLPWPTGPDPEAAVADLIDSLSLATAWDESRSEGSGYAFRLGHR